MVSSTDLPPAPSTNDAVQFVEEQRPRPPPATQHSGAAVSGSAAKICVRGRSAAATAAMPASSPPPPSGATIASTSGRSSKISSATVPLPAMNRSSSNGCTKKPVMRGEPWATTVSPALVVAGAHDRRAEPFDRANLGVGRRVHHHHRARRADRARGEGHALCGVAGADGPDAVFQLFGGELAHDVVGAANLERADRLQQLELEVDLGERTAEVGRDRRARAACGRRRGRRNQPPRARRTESM